MQVSIASIRTLVGLTAALSFCAVQAADQPSPVQPNLRTTPPTEMRRDITTNAPVAGRVDLNHASLSELQALPGVGPTTAQAIIRARPFKNVNELTNVTGIGPAKLAALKSQVTVKSTAVGRAPRSETSSGAASGSGTVTDQTPDTAPGGLSSRDRTGGSTKPTQSLAGVGQRVNLNTATREQLEALPGIGPVKAQAIINARPFNAIDDVMKVKGIKEGTFDEIKDRVTVK